jgi:hypothetical protein
MISLLEIEDHTPTIDEGTDKWTDSSEVRGGGPALLGAKLHGSRVNDEIIASDSDGEACRSDRCDKETVLADRPQDSPDAGMSLAELRLAYVLRERIISCTKALELLIESRPSSCTSPVDATAVVAAAGANDEEAVSMPEDSTEGSHGGGVRGSLVQDIGFDSAQDSKPVCDETMRDGLSRRRMKRAIRRKNRRKTGKPVRSGDNPGDAAIVAGAADPAKTAEDVFLRDPHEGSNGKEVTTSLCVGRLASAMTVPCVVNPIADCLCGLSRHSPLAATEDKCGEAEHETDQEVKPEPPQRTEVLKAYTAKNRRVRFDDATKGTADTVEVILDSGSDGHILPVSVMTKVRRAPPGSCVKGVGGGSEPLTHTGYVELLDGQAFAPKSGQFLVSIPLLDRGGCSVTIKNGRMRVYNADGSIKLMSTTC